MKTHTSAFKDKIKEFGRELDSKITYEIGGVTTELGSEELNSVSQHYNGAILKSVMKQLDIDSNVEIPVGTEINYTFGVKVRDNVVLNYRDNYDYVDFGNFIVYSVEKQEDTLSYKIVCYDKMLYAMKDYETPKVSGVLITYPITIKNYLQAICSHLGLTYTYVTFANDDKQIPEELYLDEGKNTLGYTFRDVLDEIAEVSGSTICINEDNELEIRYINNTNETIDEESLKDINVNFGEKFGAVNTLVLSRGGDGDKISLSIPSNLPDADKIAIQITDNQIMNGNDRDTYMSAILNKLYGLEYYINDFSSTGICYFDLCDKYGVTIGNTTYSCIMFNDEINITQGLEEMVYTDMPDDTEQEYQYMSSNDRGITQANIIAKKNEGVITEITSKLNDVVNGLNEVKTTQTDTNRTIEILGKNIDEDGNITAVKVKEGFTFDENGLQIYTDANSFKTQIKEDGTYFYDGATKVAEYTKEGSKQKDLRLFGVYYYGMEDINDTPMFVAQLYTDEDGEECFGHFYNRGGI